MNRRENTITPGIYSKNRISQVIVLLTIIFTVSGCRNNQVHAIQRKLFDFNWKFQYGEVPMAYSPELNDQYWMNIDLPHDWSKDGTSDDNNLQEKEIDAGSPEIGWYRKSFSLPATWKRKNISILFSGLKENSEVFINGNALVFNYEETPAVSYDLTQYLLFEKENLIAVNLNYAGKSKKGDIEKCGIYDHVWLIITDQYTF